MRKILIMLILLTVGSWVYGANDKYIVELSYNPINMTMLDHVFSGFRCNAQFGYPLKNATLFVGYEIMQQIDMSPIMKTELNSNNMYFRVQIFIDK